MSRNAAAFDRGQERFDNAYDPSYDEAQGWERCPCCGGSGNAHGGTDDCDSCSFCQGHGGEFEGKLMSEQAYEQQMRLERKERT